MPELQFLRPFWLLGLLPAVAVWWLLWRRQDPLAYWQRVIDRHLLQHLVVGDDGSRGLRPIHLLLVIWILSFVAVAGPSWRMQPSPFPADSGLMVLLKLSSSMESGDVQPSRLERARQKIRDLLSLRQGASTGLVVYSGSAHLVMPLTQDERVIENMLEELGPEVMPLDGDALEEALQLGGEMMQRAGMPGSMLVVADTVAPPRAGAVAGLESPYPVQFLSIQSPEVSLDPGLREAADALGATIQQLTPDEQDVEKIAHRARSLETAPGIQTEEQRREDAGYFLLPLLALFALFWSRRGWRVS
jgi:Ca-activated chloride channel family protein